MPVGAFPEEVCLVVDVLGRKASAAPLNGDLVHFFGRKWEPTATLGTPSTAVLDVVEAGPPTMALGTAPLERHLGCDVFGGEAFATVLCRHSLGDGKPL
jgi:hypothetical protein